MAMENAVTDQDMDARFECPSTGSRFEHRDAEPDLAVDGLTESLLSRLFRLITFRRA